MSVKCISAKQLAADLQVSRRTLDRWVRDGVCPKPIWLSPGCVRFRESDVLEWLDRESFASDHTPDAVADIED